MADGFTYFVYFSVLVGSTYFAYLAYNKFHNAPLWFERIAFSISFLIIVLVTGLRFDTGRDFMSYYRLYIAQPWNIEGSHYSTEIGLEAIADFLNYLELPPWTLFVTFALITIGLFVYSFRDKKHLLFLGIFFYITKGYFFYSFNGMRQIVAIVILAFSLEFIRERKLWKYLLTIAFGVLMHESIILFLPLYFVLPKINWSVNVWTMLAVIGIGVNVLLSVFFPRITVMVDMFLRLAGLPYFSAIERSDPGGFLNFLTPIYILRIALGFVIIYYSKKLIAEFSESSVYVKMSLIGIVVYCAFSHVYFVSRINYYFHFIDVFTLSYLAWYFISSKNYKYVTLLLTYFIGFYIIRIYTGESGVVPYNFIEQL